ncbi:MAG: hypothetical protein AAB460_02100 [Patescibacteria group bacterium]
MQKNEQEPIHFVTSVYGKKYGGMLLVLLYSISKSNPMARATIFWDDVTPRTRLLEKAFPQFEFVDTGTSIKGDFIERIANRPKFWTEAIRQHIGENFVFLDVDMLVRKDLRHFFEIPFDVAFTHKPGEVYPLNGGVYLMRASEAAAAFLEELNERTIHITNIPELREQSTTRAYPYGAPEQMAYWEMIAYDPSKADYTISTKGHPIRVHAFPCSLLNETNSKPITDEMHVIHYKSIWHDILLKGSDFNRRRTKQDSWEMYQLYLHTAQDALRLVTAVDPTINSIRDMGIVIPMYMRGDFSENAFVYRVFHLISNIQAYCRSVLVRGYQYLGLHKRPRS